MGRLIDADKCPCILCEDTRNAHCTYEHRSCKKFCDWLNNTAYNVEKVVAELEQQAEQYRNRGFEHEQRGYSLSADNYYGKQCSYLHAIDIVKRGGVE